MWYSTALLYLCGSVGFAWGRWRGSEGSKKFRTRNFKLPNSQLTSGRSGRRESWQQQERVRIEHEVKEKLCMRWKGKQKKKL